MVVVSYGLSPQDYSRLIRAGSDPDEMAAILDLSVRKDVQCPPSEYSTFRVLANDYKRKWAQKDVPKLEVIDPNEPLDLTLVEKSRTPQLDDMKSGGVFTPPVTPNTACGGPFKKKILQRFCKYLSLFIGCNCVNAAADLVDDRSNRRDRFI